MIELYLQLETYDLSNGATFNDLEQSLTPFLRSRHYWMLNTSETVRDTDIVSMEYYLGTYTNPAQECFFE